MTTPALPPFTTPLSLDGFFFESLEAATYYGQKYSKRYPGYVCRPVPMFTLPEGDDYQRWAVEVAATDNPTVRLGYLA